MRHCDGTCRAVTHTAKEDPRAGIVQSLCLNAPGRVRAFWPKTGSFKPSSAISSGGIESAYSQLCFHKFWAESVDSRFSEFWCSILVSVKIVHPIFLSILISIDSCFGVFCVNVSCCKARLWDDSLPWCAFTGLMRLQCRSSLLIHFSLHEI